MRESASIPLLKPMRGFHIFKCSNNHIYFNASTQTPTCVTCGVLSKLWGRVTESGGLSTLEPKTPMMSSFCTPKGYVNTDNYDGITRNMNAIHVCIVRLLVHLILLLHHCCDPQISSLRNMSGWIDLVYNDSTINMIAIRLRETVRLYIGKIKTMLGIGSRE
eukprot:207033_1